MLLGEIKAWYVQALVGLIGVLSYETLQFCNVDPPSARSLTGAEWNSLLVLDSGFPAALAQLVANLGNQVWYQLCECTGSATPAPPAFPAPPTGIATNTSGTAFGQCPSGAYSGTIGNDQGINVTPFLFPSLSDGPSVAIGGACGGGPCVLKTLPRPLPNTYQLSWSTGAFAVGETADMEVIFYDANPLSVQTQAYLLTTNQTTTIGATTIPATAVYVLSYIQTNIVHPSIDQANISLSGWLNGNCGQSISQCCPPVATNNDGQLAQIMQLLIQLKTQVGTPVQGYGSFLFGPITTGLSGDHFISTTGAVAVEITLTTIPTHYGRDTHAIPEYFELGWISCMNSAWITKTERIERDHQIYYLADATTLVAVTMNPGIVYSVQLLDRGP